MLIGHERFFDIVAEVDGKIVGSNFLDERNPIAGVGPVTVDPALQNDGVGRTLMQHVRSAPPNAASPASGSSRRHIIDVVSSSISVWVSRSVSC